MLICCHPVLKTERRLCLALFGRPDWCHSQFRYNDINVEKEIKTVIRSSWGQKGLVSNLDVTTADVGRKAPNLARTLCVPSGNNVAFAIFGGYLAARFADGKQKSALDVRQVYRRQDEVLRENPTCLPCL